LLTLPPVSYLTDLADREWALLEPLRPPGLAGGRPRSVNLRVILNSLLYVLRSGCQWRLLPRTYGPWSTVYCVVPHRWYRICG
jgi:putative transposase